MARRRRGPRRAIAMLGHLRRRRWIVAAGCASAAAVVGSCLLTRDPRPERMALSVEMTTGSTRFLLAVSGILNVPIRRGGRAEMLVNGDAFVPALVEVIDAAHSSAHFATYVWEPGEMSDTLLAALERAAARGVEVRLLLDGHGARNLDDEATLVSRR